MYKTIYKKLIEDIGIFTLFNLLVSLSGFILLPVITKILGAEDYGLYVQFTVTITLIVGFATLGLPYSTVRFLAGNKDKKKIQEEVIASIILILITSLIVSSFLFIFSNNIANSLFNNYTIIIYILLIIIPVECLSVALLNQFRVFQKIKDYTILNLIKTYVELSIIIGIIIYGGSIIEVTYAIMIIRIIFLVIISFFIFSLIGIGKPRFNSMNKYLKFGLPTIPSNLASWINDSSDRYIITLFLGIIFVGYYNPGYSLGALVLMFSVPFDFVLVSMASEYYNKGEISLLQEIFKYAIKYYLLLAIPAFLALSILSKPLLTILSTPEIAQEGYLITPIVGLGMLICGIGAVATGKSLFLAQKNHISMINWFIIAGVNLLLCIYLVPKFGIIGAAIATLFSLSTGFIIGLYFALKYFDFIMDWKSLIKILVATSVMSIILINFYPKDIISLLLTIVLGFIVYMGVIFSLKTIQKNEIELFKSFLKR